MGSSAGQKSIGLYRDEQKEAYREAKELAKRDMEDEDPAEGDIVAWICRAYTGSIDF